VYLLACFFLGIGNFALHKAVIESGHPFVEDSKLYFGRHFGRHGSYWLEFAVLTGAMMLSHGGAMWAPLAYLAYTSVNAIAAWMLLSGKF
jgi:hypothetical protein